MAKAGAPSSPDLHGSAPDQCRDALLLVDVISDLDFAGGARLRPAALRAAARIAALKVQARAAGVPVIYANDNFGRWRSSFHQVVNHCLQPGARGRELTRRLCPGPDDYFVVKPKHSAFYATPLEVLLRHLGTRRIVLAGFSTDSCVLATAIDAHLRDFELHVPRDAVACASAVTHRAALALLRDTLGARLDPAVRFTRGRVMRSGEGRRESR